MSEQSPPRVCFSRLHDQPFEIFYNLYIKLWPATWDRVAYLYHSMSSDNLLVGVAFVESLELGPCPRVLDCPHISDHQVQGSTIQQSKCCQFAPAASVAVKAFFKEPSTCILKLCTSSYEISTIRCVSGDDEHLFCLCRRLPCCQPTCLLAEAVQHPTLVRGTPVLPKHASPDDNKQLRLAARWQDVEKFVSGQAELSPGAIAYALYRLGCLFTYMSWQRREGQ